MKPPEEPRREGRGFSLFSNDLEAFFTGRPNRFVITAEKDGETFVCHCPNPGRMEELLFPGERLILEKREKGKGKTAWTAAALYHRPLGAGTGVSVVPLIPARANLAAEKLILPRIIPDTEEIRSEYTLGNSRFDFLCLDRRGTRHLVEVKSCSLVEYGTAMFPDAPSARALRHLKELADLGRRGYVCHILFVIVHGNPSVFVPNLHTDPAFAAGLFRLGGDLRIHAALLRCNRKGRASLRALSVPVDLSPLSIAEENRGSYLIVFCLKKRETLTVGSLGRLSFEKGWYVYAGSAQKNLDRRVARHMRKNGKIKHWHLDYLIPLGSGVRAFPIAGRLNLECALSRDLKKAGGRGIPGFGSSDCRQGCGSHLYYFGTPPLLNRGFVSLLFRFRHRDYR
jgi:sugar fermentation stimulation protein A